MKLTVIATPHAPKRTPASDGWVIRLSGSQDPNDSTPPELTRLADEAAATVRREFPNWLWHWCRTESVLDLHRFPGDISWWWYTPISEKSPLRSGFIRELYWLTLFRGLLNHQAVDSVEWIGDDKLIEAAARQIATEHRVPVTCLRAGRSRRPSLAWTMLRRARLSMLHGVHWILLNGLGYRQLPETAAGEAAFFTLFPSLWEIGDRHAAPRMFGSWPQFLSAQGYSISYPVILHGAWKGLLRERAAWLHLCREKRILFLETLITARDWVQAHLPLRFWWRYFAWRARQHRKPVMYQNTDVTRLWWRELDSNVIDVEIASDQIVSQAIRRLVARWPMLRMVFHHFEYQPMERALTNGIRQARAVRVIGLQAGAFTSNQMGFLFPAEEIESAGSAGDGAPMPDYLAAYGELPYRRFVDRLSESRVCWSGPIRYTNSRPEFNRGAFLSQHGLPATADCIAVATSIARDESLTLLESAFQVLSESPDRYLLIKCHYHRPLQYEIERMAHRHKASHRYRLFDSGLLLLLQAAPVLLCAGSSTALEAIELGCMPLVYRPIGEMPCNPMLDVPDSVFFWTDIVQLRLHIHACFQKDAEYIRRQEQWPRALTAQMSPNDGSANNRLYEFLHVRSAL
jgi:hypothetical protein